MPALVIGGGITGLTAARDLQRAGIPTILVEASQRLGGKIATEVADGFVIELGPDAMLTTRPAAVALARELGLGDELLGVSEPRSVHILRDGQPVPMPEGIGLVLPSRALPFIRTRLFSWPEKLRMGADLVMPRRLGVDDVSVGQFLRGRLGPALVSRLAGPLVGGIYGTSIDELSLDAVVPTLRTAERDHRSLILAGLADGRRMRARQKSAPAHSKPLGIFASLRGGLGQLVSSLERDIAAETVLRGVSVDRLSRPGASYRAQLSDGRILDVDGVVVTTPGATTAALLGGVAPAASAAVRSVPHGSTSVVNFAYRLEQFPIPPEGHGWLIPANEGLPLSALTWTSNKWAGRTPAGMMLVRAFLPNQPTAGQTLDNLVDLARSSIERLTGVRGAPELIRPQAYVGTMPRYTVGHLARVQKAEAEVAALPRLALAGAMHRGVGLPDCIDSGHAAAQKLISALGAVVAQPDAEAAA